MAGQAELTRIIDDLRIIDRCMAEVTCGIPKEFALWNLPFLHYYFLSFFLSAC